MLTLYPIIYTLLGRIKFRPHVFLNVSTALNIKYIVNTYPGVVSLYNEFDDLAKQILLGETLTAQPTRQTVDGIFGHQ
jgi:UDP-glucose 6-dehydrogenase